MRMRSPIGNTVEIRASEIGKIRIFIRHGWKIVGTSLNRSTFASLVETIRRSTEAFEDFERALREFTVTIDGAK